MEKLNKNPKLELNLNEENEIGFNLKIEGSDSELASTKPKIRFIIDEVNTGRGWVFGTEKNKEDDGIAIVIPNMKGLVTENQQYDGKLEVILGSRYFTPTEVDIEFVEPLKVEAAIVSKKNVEKEKQKKEMIKEDLRKKEELSVESKIDSVIIKEKQTKKPETAKPKEEEKERPKKKKKIISYSRLEPKQKKEVNKLFLAKCKKLGIKRPEKHLTEGTAYTKKKLKALVAEAIIEATLL